MKKYEVVRVWVKGTRIVVKRTNNKAEAIKVLDAYEKFDKVAYVKENGITIDSVADRSAKNSGLFNIVD